MNIFTRTFLYTLTLLVLIALLANGLVYTLMPRAYTQQKRQVLKEQTDIFAGQLETARTEDIVALMGRFAQATQADMEITIGENAYRLSMWGPGIVSETGKTATTYVIITDGKDSHQDNSIISVTVSDENTTKMDGIVVTHTLAGQFAPGLPLSRTITEQRSFSKNGEDGFLTATTTLAPVDEAVDVIVSLLPLSLVMCILAAIVFSLLYARAITRPIKEISQQTRHMTALQRQARCTVDSRDEIGALAANVNDLYENLLRTIESLEAEVGKAGLAERAKSDFLRAASHELKTPVTAISVILDNMILGVGKYKNYDEWLPKCKELIDELADMLRDILDASRFNDTSEACITESIEVIGADMLEPYAIIARAKGLSLYVDWSSAFTVTVPPKLLGRALSNVFSNAVQYTVPGGRMAVCCRGRSLIVENECPPISPDQLKRICEPFYRLDASRSRDTGGNGLGLYIADTVLRLLRLHYQFETMAGPAGMRFTINF